MVFFLCDLQIFSFCTQNCHWQFQKLVRSRLLQQKHSDAVGRRRERT
jgi:hypothetical protein